MTRSVRYRPFVPGPYRMHMGLNTLNQDDWIEQDHNLSADLALKSELLAGGSATPDTPAGAFADALPQAEDASREVLFSLAAHLSRRFPEQYGLGGPMLTVLATGERWDLDHPGLHPIDAAGRLVQEDLCVLQPKGGRFFFTGGSVCFPNRWIPAAVLGHSVSALHDPVPLFAERMARQVDIFLSRLTPDRSVWRVNWTIQDDPTLCQPTHPSPDRPVRPVPEGLFLRVERQTFRRLPGSGAVLFTIRTYIHSLVDVVTDKESRTEMIHALKVLPPALWLYKGLDRYRDSLMSWLTGTPFAAN